ncbi:MAG: hypothetical protein LN567_00190 [Rickettsia endosymbiont of Graphium doson]|nr:hypothetical protein [Rickettsia endosymbiont of Graphium doson]
MFRKYFSGLFILLILSATMYGTEGNLKLKELLDVMPQIANATSSSSAHPEICSSQVTINGVNYEVRYFSFEDTSKKLPPNMTFKEYAEKQNLLDMKSSYSSPLPEIDFESFDFRSVNLGDGVYFSMALRKIE